MSSSKRKILFLMSGSIAGFKACQVISQIVKDGHDVQVVATPATFEFIGRMTLEGLSGKKVLSDLWESGHAMDHIQLTRWADMAVLCPATANTLARVAHGLGDDLVSAMTLAWPTDKPFWIFPAMNHQMLASAATQENLRVLNTRGFRVAETQSGSLACGENGPGRMLEPDDILKLIFTTSRGRLLITGGATREPIDGIRFVSNVSTGQTAASLCDLFSARGWQITYLHGASAAQPLRADKRIGYESFADLNEKIHSELQAVAFEAVIHCAAVSDYSVENSRTTEKLSSDDELSVKFKRNFKILPRLREYSRNKEISVIGFKLGLNSSHDQLLSAAQGALGPSVDAVVANDWSQVQGDRTRHPGQFVTTEQVQNFSDLGQLTGLLNSYLEKNGGKNDSLS